MDIEPRTPETSLPPHATASPQGSVEEQLAEQLQYRALTVMLQGLRSRHELRYVLSVHLERLLPRTNGSLFLIQPPPTRHLAPVVRWGIEQDTDESPLPACVAQHMDQTAAADSLLSTVVPPTSHPRQGVCAPLMSEGELLGVLYAEQESLGDEPAPPLEADSVRRLFEVAERMTLPLNVIVMREQLQSQAQLDPLTGAANRIHMNETIERKTAEAATWGADLSVAVIDLDHFTLVNLSSGHDAGDHLLKAFTQFLRAQMDTDDLLLRLGGDEFVLVLPVTNGDEARRKLDELHARWLYETPAGSGGHTFSAGVADTHGHGTTARELLKAAHKALADAKAAGRARVVVAPPFVPVAHEETSFLAKLGITAATGTETRARD